MFRIVCLMVAVAVSTPIVTTASSVPTPGGSCALIVFYTVDPIYFEIDCVGDCPGGCELSSEGSLWTCSCFTDTPCAGVYDDSTGAFHCVANGCTLECEVKGPGPAGVWWAPCLCGQ